MADDLNCADIGSEEEYTVERIKCKVCGLTMPSVGEIRVKHVMEAHFDSSHKFGIRKPEDLLKNDEAFKEFKRAHRKTFNLMSSESSDSSLNVEQQLNDSLRNRYFNDEGEEIQEDIEEEESGSEIVSILSEQKSEVNEQVVPTGINTPISATEDESAKVTVYQEYAPNPEVGSIDVPVLDWEEEEGNVAEKHGICKWLSDVAWRKEYRELEERFESSKRLLKLFARDNMEVCAENRKLMSHGVRRKGKEWDVLCAKRRRTVFGADCYSEASSDGAESDPGIWESRSVNNGKRRISGRVIALVD